MGVIDYWNQMQQGYFTQPENREAIESIPILGETLGAMVDKDWIPESAYLSPSDAETEMRNNYFGGAKPTQEQLDNKYDDIGAALDVDLATENQKPSQLMYSGFTMSGYYGDGTWREPSGKSPNFKDLPFRAKYVLDFSARNVGGGATAFPVDYRHSPFVEPALLDEAFSIEAVMQAGFLPAFRPGDLNEGIVAHPDRHATIRVMSIDKEVIYATTNFMMEGYNKATKESFKIIESTLGNTLQLNKEKYKLFKMKLGVIDAEAPFDWLRSWEDKWDRYMRASVLAKNRWRWYILFGSHIIGGYPLQFSLGANAKDEPFTGITVDIFVTDDKPLPKMKRMISEDGLVYFRWGGTTYNPDTLQFESTIREFPTSAPKAKSPDEAEYESGT